MEQDFQSLMKSRCRSRILNLKNIKKIFNKNDLSIQMQGHHPNLAMHLKFDFASESPIAFNFSNPTNCLNYSNDLMKVLSSKEQMTIFLAEALLESWPFKPLKKHLLKWLDKNVDAKLKSLEIKDVLVKDLANYVYATGYFLSSHEIMKTKLKNVEVLSIVFERKYSNFDFDLEDSLFHVTSAKAITGIAKHGLCPRSENIFFQISRKSLFVQQSAIEHNSRLCS